MRDLLYLAPLQGFTDRHFRNAFQKCLGDVDRFYAPYLKLNNDQSIKANTKIDVLPLNNPFEPVVPQIMACGTEDFLIMSDFLVDQGYEEVNWNLGCPYPMVAKQNLGSGMLDKPDRLFSILDELIPKLPMQLGIKMRMGYESTDDILQILPQLDQYPLTEIIIHARFGKQLYNGTCDHDRFEECLTMSRHPLVYNGDICTVEDFRSLKQRFPDQKRWMIGRGAIADPFIFEMIQDDTTEYPDDRMEVFYDFLLILLEGHLNETSNEGNVLVKMKHYWEYFSTAHESGQRYYRAVKRADSIHSYQEIIAEICSV